MPSISSGTYPDISASFPPPTQILLTTIEAHLSSLCLYTWKLASSP